MLAMAILATVTWPEVAPFGLFMLFMLGMMWLV